MKTVSNSTNPCNLHGLTDMLFVVPGSTLIKHITNQADLTCVIN